MASITLLGREFPLEYTVEVMEQVAKKYGGSAEAASAVLANGENRLHDVVYLLSLMMKGGERRERVRCALYGEEYKGTPALDYDTLIAIMNADDLQKMADILVSTVVASGKQTIEVAPDPKKNKDTQ